MSQGICCSPYCVVPPVFAPRMDPSRVAHQRLLYFPELSSLSVHMGTRECTCLWWKELRVLPDSILTKLATESYPITQIFTVQV